MNALELIKLGSIKLRENKIQSYKLDSEICLSKTLNKKREEIITNLEQKITTNNCKKFQKLIERRYLKEPIAYIFEEKEFWSKIFKVTKATLIPRPETELMVDQLTKIYKNKNIYILDIGTGSGCILISLLEDLKSSKGIGIDVSNKALKIAKENQQNYQSGKRIKFFQKSLTDFKNFNFDLIVSNPPYIARGALKNLDEGIRNYEPIIALDGGNDGLDVIKKVIYKAGEILKLNGLLALEIGNGQYREVSKLLFYRKFRIEYKIKDYKENIRCVISRLISKQ